MNTYFLIYGQYNEKRFPFNYFWWIVIWISFLSTIILHTTKISVLVESIEGSEYVPEFSQGEIIVLKMYNGIISNMEGKYYRKRKFCMNQQLL